MNESARPTTARERDRALRRLRSITNGTAVIATMATAGFGALAAFTWSGTTTGTAADGTTINSTVTDVDDAATDSSAADTPGTTSQDPTATASPIQPTPTPIATTTRKARVTSGGSG